MEKFSVSIDGGGTKTEVCIYNEKRNIIKCRVYDGININQIGNIRFNHIIQQIFSDIQCIEDCNFCIGVPGYGESSECDKAIQSSIYMYVNKENCILVNDVELAHYASFALGDGVLLLSGTGSMLLSVNNGVKKRAGGWGYLIGDEGSSFYIGLKALNHISHVFDFNTKRSILSQMICDKYNLDFPSKLVNYIYSSGNYRKDVAKLSQTVNEAAECGCPVANDILEESAKYFVEMTELLMPDVKLNISYAGGTFSSQILRKNIENQGNFHFTPPRMKPVLGGIIKLANPKTENEINRIVDKLNALYQNEVEKTRDESNKEIIHH